MIKLLYIFLLISLPIPSLAQIMDDSSSAYFFGDSVTRTNRKNYFFHHKGYPAGEFQPSNKNIDTLIPSFIIGSKTWDVQVIYIDDDEYLPNHQFNKNRDTEFVYSHIGYLRECAKDSMFKYRRKLLSKKEKNFDKLLFYRDRYQYFSGQYDMLYHLLYPKYYNTLGEAKQD